MFLICFRKPLNEIVSYVCTHFRSTFDEGHMRGYIDMFLTEQKENRGKYFTDDDLIINCQVRTKNNLLKNTKEKDGIFVR